MICKLLQTIQEKSTLTLSCNVIGYPEPEITWLFQDKPITASFKNKMSRAGDTCQLVTSQVTKKMTGVYKVVAKNRVGVADHSAEIHVEGKTQ